QGRTLAEGKDLADLKRRLAPQVSATLSKASGGIERHGLTTWDFGTLPHTYQQGRVRSYPALADEGDSVAIRTCATEAEQARSMWHGTRRLILLTSPSPAKPLLRGLDNQAKLLLSHAPHGGAAELLDDCVACAVDKLIIEYGGPAWDQAGFQRLTDQVRAR